jgi:shikimate dehydrogenase
MSHLVTSRTRVFALLGDPVQHSLSPVVQNAAFQEAGVDGVYVSLLCRGEDLQGFIRGIGGAGGGGNLTLPHKERAATVVDHPSDAVRRIGACNTFWEEDGKIHGDNTDVEGFRRALREFLGRSPEGYRVLMIGAGGAARASLLALLEDDVKEVLISNRTTERARAVARRIGGERTRVADTINEVRGESFDLVVNTTRLGLAQDDPLPFDLTLLDRAGAVMDLVYGPNGTPFVHAARDLGIKATDGGEMLVQQGAVAFECWWGTEAPLPAMKEALDAGRRLSA